MTHLWEYVVLISDNFKFHNRKLSLHLESVVKPCSNADEFLDVSSLNSLTAIYVKIYILQCYQICAGYSYEKNELMR